MSNAIRKLMWIAMFAVFIASCLIGIVYVMQPSQADISIKPTNSERMEAKYLADAFPSVKAITPRDGGVDIVLDIEDPIAVSFKDPIPEFWVKVEIKLHEHNVSDS